MKVKLWMKAVIVVLSTLLLAACAHKRPYQSVDEANSAYSDGQVRVSGLGGQGIFSDGRSLVNHRTYYFDFDSFAVREEDKLAIYANARYLVAHPNIHVQVITQGHTDPRGSREYNIGLGERRAKAVQALLIQRGVNPSRIHIVSYGSEKLASPGHTEADYQFDRRVVLGYQG